MLSASDVEASQPFVNTHLHLTGRLWQLRDCKMRRPQLVENPRVLEAATKATASLPSTVEIRSSKILYGLMAIIAAPLMGGDTPNHMLPIMEIRLDRTS